MTSPLPPSYKSIPSASAPGKSHQLPNSMVAKEFGEVDVTEQGAQVDVEFTILLETIGEGWQTGVAIDASGSMSRVFGNEVNRGPNGDPPRALTDEYYRRGWIVRENRVGGEVRSYTREARVDLVARGHAVWSRNDIEPLAQQMTSYLASKLDVDGNTTVIYWACGDGSGIEEVGDLTADQCSRFQFTGPANTAFGTSTRLFPAMQYFVDRFSQAPMGMYIFITDGELHDLDRIKKYTIQLCQEIEAGKRNPIKCVLVGIGEQINEQQMVELDDLESGTNVDIWDHKIARDMRSLVDIFAEIVSENQIVAQSGRILDSSGNVVKEFRDGLPARIKFSMPSASPWFVLEVPGQALIRQDVVVKG